LKRISASALSDICKHSPSLAQAVVEAGAVAYLAPLVSSTDAKLKRQVCSALAQISKHSVDLAELVVEGEIFPGVLDCLKDPDLVVKKNSATLIREIAKHTPEMAQLVVNFGGVAAIVDYVRDTNGNNSLPGIMALGYIAAFSETLALAVIVEKGVPQLTRALIEEQEDHIRAAAAWSLGHVGRHTSDHAKAVTDAHVLPRLLERYLDEASSDDLKTKCKRALKCIIEKCTDLQALEPLLAEAPTNIVKYVVQQFAKILPHDVAARRAFVSSGGLQKVQELNTDSGSKLQEYVDSINACYPEEIVKYYSPGYSQALLEKLDQYQAQ